jgi:hypothetical protein
MSISNIIVVVLVVVFFSLILALIVISNLRPSMFISLSPSSGAITQTNIGGPSDVRNNFMSPSAGTIIVYINYKANDKTSSLNNIKPIRMLELQNVLKIEMIPGNSKNQQTTKLSIKTNAPSSSTIDGYEVFPIRNIPEQKWIHLAIVREGRRYTLYYNGEAIFSNRTIGYPVVNYSQLIIGDNRLSGIFALPKIAPTEYRLNDILSDLKATSDTRHKPYLPTDSIFPQFYFIMPTFGCPNGLFCFSTSSAPTQNPLKKWVTPYA